MSSATIVWEQARFHELQAAVGTEKSRALLASYGALLNGAASDIRSATSNQTLRAVAHDLKSSSGQLGFVALSDYCHAVMQFLDADVGRVGLDPWLKLIALSEALVREDLSRTGGPDTRWH